MTAFLYTNNEGAEREIRETIPSTITSKRIKYLGINLPKETKDLYSEKDNYTKKKKNPNQTNPKEVQSNRHLRISNVHSNKMASIILPYSSFLVSITDA